MIDDSDTIKVSKLDAARRQLKTAIVLWFEDGDPVSIHTLAFAAYEIVHVVSKKRNRQRDLLFDSRLIKDEGKTSWSLLLKSSANFFKHARNDADKTLEFRPSLTELFFIYTIAGLQLSGESLSPEESAFMFWLQLHRPDLLAEGGRVMFLDRIPVEHLEDIQRLPKTAFFKAILEALDTG